MYYSTTERAVSLCPVVVYRHPQARAVRGPLPRLGRLLGPQLPGLLRALLGGPGRLGKLWSVPGEIRVTPPDPERRRNKALPLLDSPLTTFL